MSNWTSLLIALAALLWSTDALFRLPLTHTLSAYTIVFYEHLFALVFVLPIIIKAWAQVRGLTARQWWAIVFIGMGASAIATIAFTASFSYVNVSVAILLLKLQPLFTFVLAYFMLGERLPRRFWWWAALALLGAYVVSFPELVPTLALYHRGLIGIGLAVLAAAIWGSATVFGRYLLNGLPFAPVTALRFATALPLLAVLAVRAGGAQSFALSAHDVLFLICIVFISGFGAMYIYYRGLYVTKASLSALLELIFPVSAVVLNWIFLHQTLTWVQVVGGLVLVGSIVRLTIWRSPVVA